MAEQNPSAAADLDPGKDLQWRLEQSRAIVEKVKDSFQADSSTVPEIPFHTLLQEAKGQVIG